MDAKLLQEFRAMQLAVKGSYNGRNVDELILQDIDRISVSYDFEIVGISLDTDLVIISLVETERHCQLNVFSDNVINDIINTMRCKALEIADKDVRVNVKGEIVE